MTEHQSLILNEKANSLLVENGDGNVTLVRDTAKNRLLYEYGLKQSFVDDGDSISLGGEAQDGGFVVSIKDDSYQIQKPSDGGFSFEVPDEKEHELIGGVYSALEDNSLKQLTRLYREISDKQVRPDVVSILHQKLDWSDVEIQESGVVIDGMFKLDWNCELRLVGEGSNGVGEIPVESGVMEVNRGSLIQFQNEYIHTTTDEERTIETPTGPLTLRKIELRFFAIVEWLTDINDRISHSYVIMAMKQFVKNQS